LPKNGCCSFLSGQPAQHASSFRTGPSNIKHSLQCYRLTYKPVGFYGPIANVPSSECPRASIAACRRFNQNIPPTVVLLQQCHCRKRHSGKLQNLSPPSVLFESSPIFLQYTGDTGAKKVMDQNFEIRLL